MLLSLKSISVTNFRAINGSITLDFSNLPPGLYFISGRNELELRLGSNGVAKSTLFVDSIYWALTGKVSRSQRPGPDIENWELRKQPVNVAIRFSLDNVDHCIARKRNPIILYLDGEQAEQSTIDNLLPLTDSALRQSIIIDQFGDMFLSLRPEDKSRIFSETLDLDLWVKGADRAGKEIIIIERELANLNNELSGIVGALNEARDQFDLAELKEESFEAELKQQLKEKRQIRADAAYQAEEARAALNTARDALSGVSPHDNRAMAANNLRSLLRPRQQAVVDAKNGASRLRIIISESEAKLSKYLRTEKVCPECGQKVSDNHIKKKKRELQDLLLKSKSELSEANVSVSDANAALDMLNTEIETIDKELVDYKIGRAHV